MNKTNLIKKQAMVDALAGILSQSRISVLANFSGLPVSEMEKLRRRLQEHQGRLKVVKNTLLKRACQLAKAEQLATSLSQPIFLAWSEGEDEVSLVKTLIDFSRAGGQITLQGGYRRGEYLPCERLEMMGKLPGLKQLQLSLVQQLRAPMSRLVFNLRYPVMKLVRTLNAVSQKKEKENGQSGNGRS